MTDRQHPLREISLSQILTRDSSQVTNLLEACISDGCFYLSLQDPFIEAPYNGIYEKADRIFEIANEFFQLPIEQKLSWRMDAWGDLQIGGYKPVGKHSGVASGTQDGFENFLVPLNALLCLDSNSIEWPRPFAAQLPLLQDFEFTCHRIAQTLLSALSDNMPVKPDIPFQDLHRKEQRSTTSLGMLKYLPNAALSRDEIGHMAHTDVGSLTLLFTSSPGLEVFVHNRSWIPVYPSRGKIIVNVGDALRFISGQQFQSCVHRVVPPMGLTGFSRSRFSLAYFQRPELATRFLDGEGREWTGEEWHRTKYRIFAANEEEQRKTSLLSGKKGFLGKYEGHNAEERTFF